MSKENSENTKDNYIYHMIRDLREMNGLKFKPEHKAILFSLESRGKKLFPSHETLAQDCGMGITKLKSALNQLRSHEVLSWIEGKGSSNRYKLNRSEMARIWHEQMLDENLGESLRWNNFHPEWDL